jgi:hypothetical protein
LAALKGLAKLSKQDENFYRPPQKTCFEKVVNTAGVQMEALTGSGQDLTGINDGFKSSTLMNYTPDAWNHGAEIFCGCEVKHVKRDSSGRCIVFFAYHGGS